MQVNVDPVLLRKAKSAESPEELLALAKENRIELTPEQAREHFDRLHQTGELSDEELDNVAGGGCQTKVGGKKYTVVSSGVSCFTGGFAYYCDSDGNLMPGAIPRSSGWSMFSSKGCCGCCAHLRLHKGLGYCELEDA